MITCSSCGKQNQDHYKFCLGCGSELPRDQAPSPLEDPVTGGGKRQTDRPPVADEPTNIGPEPVKAEKKAAPKPVPKPAPAPAPAPAAVPAAKPAAAASGGNVVCPECSHDNPPGNRFCASCGFKLEGVAATPAAAPAAKPAAPRPAAASGVDDSVTVVLTALNPDGAEAGTYELPKGGQTVGRETAPIFSGDSYLSPKHATFTPRSSDVLSVKDEGSLNGVYRKLIADQRYALAPHQIFRIGQELIRFEPLDAKGPDQEGVEPMGGPIDGYVGRIAMVLGRESTGTAFPVPDTGLNLGRERGEVLFADDGYVSGLHCRLSFEGGTVYLTDLGSSNGTFVRIIEEEEIGHGDILLMGQQLFRIAL